MLLNLNPEDGWGEVRDTCVKKAFRSYENEPMSIRKGITSIHNAVRSNSNLRPGGGTQN